MKLMSVSPVPDVPPAGQLLRDAVASGIIAVPGAFNALAARMIEQAGFPACYLSGAAFSAGVLGLPDIGLFTLTELVQQTSQLTRATRLPLIVDADTGFGGTANVERTVIELELAGAAAIQLEDQELPKRCGHLSGKSLVSCGLMCEKIRAAAAARQNPSLVIIARTDARGVDGMDEALQRAEQYLHAGADWIFPEALQSEAEFQQFAQRIKAPLVANMTEFGKSPLLPISTLAGLGFAVVLYPVTLLRLAMRQVQQGLEVLLATGTQASMVGQMLSRQELYDTLGYESYEQRDRAYFQSTPPTR
jgi:methylisocitrate lyase